MAGFAGFISVLSAMMLYVQQKTSDYLVILNLKTPPFFKNILTLGTPPLPPPQVTRYVTKTLLNTHTVTAEPWSTVTSATSVYVRTPLPSAAYTAIVSGQNIHGHDSYNSYDIVPTRSPWQRYHLLIAFFVFSWVPLMFILTKLYDVSRARRHYWHNDGVRQATEEYHRKLRQLEVSYRPRIGPGFFDRIYEETYAWLLRRHRKIDPYLQNLQDALTAACNAVLDQIYVYSQVVFERLVKALVVVSRVLFERLCRLMYHVLRLLYCLVIFAVIPACQKIWLYLKTAVFSPIQEQAVEPLIASIKTNTMHHISSVQAAVASSPLLKRLREHTGAGQKLNEDNLHGLPPSTPVQPNHF
ncbi:hypothetical protein A1O3_09896 [Capronia epimyces CBS 606.96]|uniref:DUF3533 domain-containing protein n=1 Tax=Capronia epimyces CBS 606.96 TaxID=1182542 RepID=W9XAZ4_9EURO|nr:uncharacterized protein A1O3_09896 [Capronia epimyces CBS 606.96]EXJ77667.1 hypothetical protein A1O3_09896 [Capronia epimyces CBS 606.96]